MDLAPGASASPQLARDGGRRSDPLGVGIPLASSFGAVPDELLHDLLDQIDLSVVVVDPAEPRVVYANRHAGVTLSPPPGEAAPDGFAALLAACCLGLEDSWGRARTARMGERTVGFTPYRLENGRVCLFVRDITHRSHLDSLAAARTWAENLESLFSTIRHELANPLNAIKMTLSVLQHNITRFPAGTVEDYLARAMGEVARLERLLRALRTFGALGSPRVRRLQVEGFLDQVAGALGAELRARGVEVETTIETETGFASADPVALRQVISNLVANSVDAVEGGARPAIRLSARRAGDLVLLRVVDNGCGIPADLQPRLFEPFFTTKPAALGLGLTISRKLLVQMGAQLSIASTPGAGTEATISLAGWPDQEPT